MRHLIVLFASCCLVSASAQVFTEVSAEAGIDILPVHSAYMGGGVAIFDYDNDQLQDIYVTGCNLSDKLYRNNGDWTFTDVSESSGILYETQRTNTIGVTTGDIDNDGDRDLFVYTWWYTEGGQYAPNLLYRNEGNGTFTEIGEEAGLLDSAFTQAAAFFDVNLDGWLDLYVGNYIESLEFIQENGVVVGFAHQCFDDRLYLNNQDGTFTDVTSVYGLDNDGCTLACAATDYDRDGDTDLMIANDFGEWVTPNRLYRNNHPSPSFTEISAQVGVDIGLYGMGFAIGDHGEDGDLDHYCTNIGHAYFMENTDGQFEDIAEELGVDNTSNGQWLHTSWGTAFMDADNDSYEDLFVATGHMPSVDFLQNLVLDPNKLFRANGDGTYTDVSEAAGIDDTAIGRGMAYGDLDNDGDLDVAVVNIENNEQVIDEHFLLYRNDSPEQHWIALDLQGITSNADAIGSQVELYANGRMLLREQTGGTASHNSQHSHLLHFGLGSINTVDSITVSWPGGQDQTVYEPAIDQVLVILQEEPEGITETERMMVVFPNPSHGEVFVQFPSSLQGEGKLSIYDAQGRCVFTAQRTFRAGTNRLDELTGLPAGTYTIRWANDHSVLHSTIQLLPR